MTPVTPGATTRGIEVIGLTWALGIGYLTSAYFVCYIVHLSIATGIVLSLVISCLLTGATLRGTRTRRPMTGHTQEARVYTYLRAAALCCAALPVVIMTWMSVRSPLAGWDGWSIWAFKGVAFAQGGPPMSYFRDPTTLHTHPDYPLNLPLAESILFHLPTPFALPLATLLGPACFAALLCIFYAGLARIYGLLFAAVGTAILTTIPIFVDNVPAGGADVPLCLYAGGAATYLLVWWTRGEIRDAVLAALLAGGAAWTKKEGLAIAVVILGVAVVYEVVARRRNHGVSFGCRIAALCTACAIPLPWFLFVRMQHPLPRDFDPVTVTTLGNHLDRLPHLVVLVGQQMVTWGNWGAFWIVLGCAIVWNGRRLAAPGRALAALLATQVGVYVVVFVFSNWQPYDAHAQGTLDRLLLQATPLAVLVLLACVHRSACAGAIHQTPSDGVDGVVPA
jgi:hypothetical protein